MTSLNYHASQPAERIHGRTGGHIGERIGERPMTRSRQGRRMPRSRTVRDGRVDPPTHYVALRFGVLAPWISCLIPRQTRPERTKEFCLSLHDHQAVTTHRISSRISVQLQLPLPLPRRRE
jgi:hypothetical protein